MQREAHEAQSRMLGWNSESPYATTAHNLARSGSASLFRHGKRTDSETVELHRAAHAASRRVPLTAWSGPAGASRASTWVTPPFKSPRLAQLRRRWPAALSDGAGCLLGTRRRQQAGCAGSPGTPRVRHWQRTRG
jgi:hypothetical protein